MTQNSPNTSTEDGWAEPADNLDRLFSDFFKSELKNPWPAAPATPASEPSVLVATRNARTDAHRNQPMTAARDTSSKSRYTLAASVALFLGTCWYLSNGFQPGDRPNLSPATNGSGPSIKDVGAGNPDVLKKLREDKATGGNGLPRPKLELP
jgi:hypothetical protein